MMSANIIYRVENIHDEKGIFNSRNYNKLSQPRLSDKFSFVEKLHSLHGEYSSPYRDEKISNVFNSDYLCAFKSKSDLNKYILSKWIDELKYYGFRIYEIEVSECVEGDDQYIYKPQHVISKKDITNQIKYESI